MRIALEFKGEPRSKLRPQFARRGKFMTSFTPEKTRVAEADLRSQAIAQLPKDFVPLKGALRLNAVFRRQKPKSAGKKVKYAVTRPDLDNYLKLLLDALNSIVFEDDSQIVWIGISKVFGTPGITMEIIELEDEVKP